jgi:CBS domain containing-hemolysin-like protein
MSQVELALLLLGLLLASAFFSGTEIAATMSSRVRLRTRAERGSRLAGVALRQIDRRANTIALCLVGSNLVSVALGVYGREAMASWLALGPVAADTVTPLVMVPLVLVFGEIVPKAVAQMYPNRTLIAMTPGLLVTRVLLAPLFWLCVLFSELTRRLARIRADVLPFASREELKQFVARSEVRGFVEPQERELIHHIVEFWKLDPRMFVRGLHEVPHLEAGMRVRDAARQMCAGRVARLVVVRDGGVIGVVRAAKLLVADPGDRIENHLEPPVQLQGLDGLDRILAAMQESPAQTGVLPVPGAGAGVVLMDDLVDALVGRRRAAPVARTAGAAARGAAGAVGAGAADGGQESA